MAGTARPGEACRIIGHAGTDGIEVDVAVAVQYIALTVDQTGLVAALPQCPGTPVTGVELADVAASELLHETRDCTDLWRGSQQVNMVIHQYVGVQLAARVEQGFAQQRQVTSPIVIIEKAGRAVVAALDHVLRNPGQVES